MSDHESTLSNEAYEAFAALQQSESQYNAARNSFSGSASYLGISASGSYDQFKAEARQRINNYQIDTKHTKMTEVVRSILSQTSGKAYENCLAALTGGIVLKVRDIGQSVVTVSLTYVTAKDDKTPRRFSQRVSGGRLDCFSAKFFNGEHLGAIPSYPLLIHHTPHEELIFQVGLESTDASPAIVDIPPMPQVLKKTWSEGEKIEKPISITQPTTDQRYCLQPDSMGREGVWQLATPKLEPEWKIVQFAHPPYIVPLPDENPGSEQC